MSDTTLRLLPIMAMAVAGACSTGPSFEVGPNLAANPNPSVPLAAVVRFEADGPVDTRIDVSDGVNAWTLDYDESHDPSRGLGVYGMRPDRDHEIRVTIRNGAGEEASAEPLPFRTPPLPEVGVEFPPVETTVSRPESMEPGVTLFNPRRRRVGAGQEIANFNAGFGMLMVLDQAGEVTWYYRVDSRISDFEKVGNGNLIFVTADFRMIEIDWLGNTVNQWYAANRPEGPAAGIPVDTQSFHHEIDELPNGNIIVLSSEWKEVDNYYTDEYDENAPRQRQKVMGDVIVEFERDTGNVVWEWRAFDHMDPFRIGYETFSNYWIRRGFPDTLDWSHANNLLYDESDDSIIINFRYQAAAMKIDRASREIRWIFGEPSGWGDLSDKVLQPDGEFDWPYHQHSPNPTPNGTLLIYNNGNYEARPFNPPAPVTETYSRAVEYEIDDGEHAGAPTVAIGAGGSGQRRQHRHGRRGLASRDREYPRGLRRHSRPRDPRPGGLAGGFPSAVQPVDAPAGIRAQRSPGGRLRSGPRYGYRRHGLDAVRGRAHRSCWAIRDHGFADPDPPQRFARYPRGSGHTIWPRETTATTRNTGLKSRRRTRSRTRVLHVDSKPKTESDEINHTPKNRRGKSQVESDHPLQKQHIGFEKLQIGLCSQVLGQLLPERGSHRLGLLLRQSRLLEFARETERVYRGSGHGEAKFLNMLLPYRNRMRMAISVTGPQR